MVTIKITERSIEMSGHAGKKENDGIDRACAAISALTCNLINSLREISGDNIRAETATGWTMIRWKKLSDAGKTLVDSWFLGITEINRQYNCIEIK